MHLKTLTVRGFKSFASATRFDFEPGITCVVGPNGSGKSNVVDALAWVMGEQGAKTLRGGKMEDVIFAGTSARPALGRAEVSLTIDNSDGRLPIEFSEVTITRTLFRQGGSEYAINGAPVRLLDIQELLSDTGLGREMHVIVGQGQLDTVLRATPTERRGFIEEAAGVLKHRRRKEKALRKLDSMQGNLLRLADLLAELSRQLGPLARQAQAAQRAAILQAIDRDTNQRLLADDLTTASALLKDRQQVLTQAREQRDDINRQLDVVRSNLAHQEKAAADASPRRSALSQAVITLSRNHERLKSLIHVAEERLRHLGDTHTTPPITTTHTTEAAARHVRTAITQLDAQLTEQRDKLARITATRTALTERLNKAERAHNDQVAAHRHYEKKRDQLTADLAAHRALMDNIADDLATAQQSATEALAALNKLSEPTDLPPAPDTPPEQLNQARAMERTWAARSAELARELATATSNLSAAQARVDILTAQLRDVPTHLSDHHDVHGTLVEFLDPTAAHAPQMMVVLGSLLDALVVATEKGAYELAQADDNGQLHLIHLPPVTESSSTLATSPHLSEHIPGLISAPDPQLRAQLTLVLHQWLADTVHVPHLEDARAWVKAHPTDTAVTDQCDVVRSHHINTRRQGSAHALVKEERDRHHHDVATWNARCEELTREHNAAVQRHQAAIEQVRVAEEQWSSERSQYSDLRAQHAHASAQREGARVAHQRATSHVTSLMAKHTAAHTRVTELTTLLNEHLATEPEQPAAQSSKEREALNGELRILYDHETETKVQLRALQEQRTAQQGKLASLTAAIDRERRAIEVAQQLADQRARQRQATSEVAEQAHALVIHVERSERDAREQLALLEDAYLAANEHISGLRNKERSLSERHDEAKDHLHTIDLEVSALHAEHTRLIDRAMAEFGFDAEQLIDQYGPHQYTPNYREALKKGGDSVLEMTQPFDRAGVEAARESARKKLSTMGKINPLALEEYKALEERHAFLAQQLDDLKKSRADLLTLIRDIDDEVKAVFLSAYEDTAAHFERIFPRLFPGGTGRMTLTDPQDPLGTGIEIEARPAGKKVTRISLLSGGERSLVAVALLVAIFKARPSPFYVMDEVEAALDDMNLSRLLLLFKELQEDSQLIVITHQKRTMEISDALYGVTMHNDGVSTVISHRLTAS